MIRRIIRIDEGKCTGCGRCAEACHEGAIGMVDGKARLLRDDCCDGLGDCLPSCPAGAISFEEREARPYDEEAVKAAKGEGGCPGSRVRTIGKGQGHASWPLQIKLVPPSAPFLDGADLLVAADCTAYSYASFHDDLMAGRVTLIGCPKLDGVDYAEKLAAILSGNDIRSILLARMEVPCCGGLEMAVKRAIAASGKAIPFASVTVSIDGRIL